MGYRPNPQNPKPPNTLHRVEPEIPLTPKLTRSLDAGLFANHAPNLAELDELRRWLASVTPKEAPCASVR